MSDRHPTPGESPHAFADHIMRIGLVVLLIVWTFYIVRPFLMPLLWAVIIAVSLYPVYTRIASALGGRRALAAVLTTVLALAVLFVPSVYLGGTLVDTVEHLTAQADEGGIRIPPPPDGVGSQIGRAHV